MSGFGPAQAGDSARAFPIIPSRDRPGFGVIAAPGMAAGVGARCPQWCQRPAAGSLSGSMGVA